MSKKTKIKVIIVKSAEGAAAAKETTTNDVTESKPMDLQDAKLLIARKGMKQESKTQADGQTKYVYA